MLWNTGYSQRPSVMTAKHLIVFLASTAILHAAPRPWKSEDGQRSVFGEFVKRDSASITIRRADRQQVVIPIEKLHPDDRSWIDAHHPLGTTPSPEEPSRIFDTLSFGDTREQVLSKLKASEFVMMTTDETFIGRTGLNGIFKTRRKIGGLDAMLYFDWSANDQLQELNLQTANYPASEINGPLTTCWKEFIELLTTLHGKPLHADRELRTNSIPDGSMLPTHLWKLEGGGSAMLGAAKEGNLYQIVVRLTRKEVKPIAMP
jgi:hypothetical protein